MSARLILASASEARADLLRNAGVDIDIAPARIDEDEVKAQPGQYVLATHL